MKIFKIIILSSILLSINLLANSVATITALKGLAVIERAGESIEASLGAKLEAKDTIITKEKSKLQIIFKDETIISLGKNSNFSIKEYLFEDNQAPIAKFGMLKGAMRAITGKIGEIAPDKFTVQAKTATIGIRGTNFSVVVGDDGSYQIYCTYGTISVSIGGKEYIVKQGFYINISPDEIVEIKEFSAEDLKNMRDKNFGKNEQKESEVSKSDTAESDNNEQLNLTVTEDSAIIIKDVSDITTDNIQISATDLPSLLASYSMNNALYSGTYTTISGVSGLGANGSAELLVNFGADTATLTLNGGTAIYSQNPTFSGTDFSLGLTTAGTGSSTGTFEGPTGNSAIGNFTYNDGNADSGTYNVSTSQKLH
ncbi:FecR family protein [Sulfurimonas sp.]|uniref:FecR family protein n=1 Tax=Sulfurimonas sp. TaxID=2022749 RepID=UPI0026204891|nr:FecR family protein [Sulfurimonas sp.]MCW8894736.1 FecR family protein [Sulfurimonas sp.]MCW9067551.1 FecR family protein [Sulfurimonas sp.]